MAAWARALVQGSHNAINYQREFSFRCLHQVRIILIEPLNFFRALKERCVIAYCLTFQQQQKPTQPF